MPNTIKEEVSRLKELMHLKEGCGGDVVVTNEPNHVEENHKGSYMAKQQLYNIAKKAQSVHDRLDNGTRLEDWMESKIAQMSDGIDSVTNSFDYDEHEEHNNGEIATIDLGEQIMAGLQAGYADDSGGDNAYDFESKGALGSQTELGDEGFTEPETNYSKEKKGYNFDSDGPQDSYMDSSDEYNMELGYELGEQEDGGGTGESDDGAGAGTASLGVWESGIARGIANQIATGKWSDSYATTRGKSNPVW
jgi:hypothetical protein